MANITTDELRGKYLDFFKAKGHTIIPSAPLKPDNDPSVLFTTAGMHPLVPYLKGEEHPQGTRLADAQRCLRTTDIEEVGDDTHATVFEMLGNWSLGDYFKEDAIAWSWEFLTDPRWLGLNPNYLAVSVFGGNDQAPRDEESAELWQAQGVAKERIAYLGVEENWWPAYSPSTGNGDSEEPTGPQGPDTEMFYWTGAEEPPHAFDPEDERWVEIWNDVFMQYERKEGEALGQLARQNVDTGMGLERVVMVLNGQESIYDVDSFAPLLAILDEQVTKPDERQRRILADHIKAATFILGDTEPIAPSNRDQGYVLRRLIRRAVRAARLLGIADVRSTLVAGAGRMVDTYQETYPSLGEHRQFVERKLGEEVDKFEAALERGTREFERLTRNRASGEIVTGEEAFRLYESFGFPLELTEELAHERGLSVDAKAFQEALARHQEVSREGSAQKFAGGLADHSEASVQYHTATHLLHQALRDVLGEHVWQKGSNITPERLRFDFSHDAKMTDDEKARVERIVNEKIMADMMVERREMSVPDAKELGALGLFEDTYDEVVSVYSIGDYSREICGGPHVDKTSDLGRFRITKEESAGSGIRRVKAVLEEVSK